jgi:lipase
VSEGIRRWGPEGAPSVFLLHCALAHGGAWEKLARILSDRYRLIAPDMVGHGAGPDGDRTRDYHDQATEQARALLPEGPVHLVGHSFGATVALRLAIEEAERVASLTMYEPVLFAAAPDGDAKRRNAETLASMTPMIAAGDTEQAARLFLSVWGAGGTFDALPPPQAAYMAERMWTIAAQQPSLHQDSARLLPRLGTVACPVLLMQGSASPPVIGQILDRLEEGLRDTRRILIEGGGHMAPVTHAKAVAEPIGRFLDGLG